MALPLYNDFEKLVTEKIPLIDVRAPVEFAKGAFPTAHNLPLLDDKERELVGIRYKNNGNEAAVKLGHQLVSGDVKEQRITAWIDFIEKHPDAMLYCFRGGQRSRISQQWLHERGYPIVRIEGGYKAFRNYLLKEMEQMEGRFTPVLLGGRTGSGKTLLIHKLQNSLDLEGIARHRGSAFGRHITPQPTQVDFEDRLAFALLQKIDQGYQNLILEDEGKNVGRVYIPAKLSDYIAQGGLVILETPLHERVEITFDEYVTKAQKEYESYYHEAGQQRWAEDMLNSIDRIQRRLGGKRHKEIRKLFENAFQAQQRHNDFQLHKLWIEPLLRDYYDPMYDYQLLKRENRILFRGDKEAVLAYLQTMG